MKPPLRRGRRAARETPDELDVLAREPSWMYEFDLGGGVRTTTMSPELMDIHRTRAAVSEPVVREVLADAGAAATAIDLACSEGWFAHRLLEWGAGTVCGVDIRAENIRRAALVRDRLGIEAERLTLRTSDVFDLDPDELGTFDAVLCLGLVYHLENPVGALRIARALTRGVCIVESQLTEQVAPIRHGWGQTGQFLDQPGELGLLLRAPAAAGRLSDRGVRWRGQPRPQPRGAPASDADRGLSPRRGARPRDRQPAVRRGASPRRRGLAVAAWSGPGRAARDRRRYPRRVPGCHEPVAHGWTAR